MKKSFNLGDILFFLLGIILLLVTLNYYSVMSYYEMSVAITVMGLLVVIHSLADTRVAKIISFIVLSLVAMYVITQTIYFRAFWSYYRLSYAFSMLGTLSNFTDSAMEFVGKRDLILPLTLILLLAVFLVYKGRMVISVKRSVLLTTGILLMVSGISSYGYRLFIAKANDNKYSTDFSEYYIYNTIPSNQKFVEEFGFLTYMVRDVQALFENRMLSESKWEIEEYLLSRGERKDNMMTGIFKDKSVLIIQAESLSDVAINKKLTPYLWMMKNEGINIDGFKTPLLPGSTSDSEFMANLSLIPDSTIGSSHNEYPYNSFKVTLPRMFNFEGYDPIAFHNLWSTMYNRETFFSQIGYKNFFDNVMVSDTEEANDIIDRLATSSSKIMAFWVTYSGHQPYTLSEAEHFNALDYEIVQDNYPDLSDENAVYIAKNMDLDHALEKIVNAFAENGHLDDWVFVIYGDHFAKGLDYTSDSNLVKTMGGNDVSMNTDFFIYNSVTGPYTLRKVGTTLDIIPTLANMFDLKYQYRTIMGHDLFDDEYHGFYFSNSQCWETNDYYYDLNTGEIELKDGTSMSIDDALEQAKEYQKLPELSRKLLMSDYFKNQ